MDIINKQEKIKHINSFKKEEEIHTLLEELLPEMGFNNVIITHERGNRPEDGKDLICSKYDEIEDKNDWYAFVVKKAKVAGSSQAINEIESQVIDCFKYEYKSIFKPDRIKINKVKVVTNFHFSAGAKDKILRNDSLQKSNIDFWDAERLLHFIDKYNKQYWQKGSKSYKKYINRLEKRIRVDTLSKTLGIDDAKMKRLLKNLIDPHIVERYQDEEGGFKWKKNKSSTIVNLPHNSVIVGDAGSGKTTLFKTLSTELITQNSIRNNIDFYPILLTFTSLRDTGYDLENALFSYFNRDWTKDLEIDVNYILENNKCCIFIDALDELAIVEEKEKALDSINAFHKKYPEIKIICSSRPSDYLFHNCEDVGFKYLEISPLARNQIESFVNNYFGEELIKSKKLLQSLRDTGLLEKLPNTPLTIALVTILFDENEVEIPATITDLYSNFVDLLLGKYKPESTIDIIEVGAKHRLLCYIAKELHFSKKKYVTESELLKWIKKYAEERGHKYDYSKVIDDIIDNTGLLIKNGRSEIQFKHLSFQEYFTAYEIFHHRQSESSVLTENFNNLWWQNVTIFYGGMSKDAPELIETILKNNKPKNFIECLINTGGLGRLLQSLYNTSLNERIKGLDYSTNNMIEAINIVIEDHEAKELKIWRTFSKFALMQILKNFHNHSHRSITLVEPLKDLFDEKISIKDKTQDDIYFLFLIASILASDEYRSFSELKILIKDINTVDNYILALLDTHIKQLTNQNKSLVSNNEDLKFIKKKINKRKKAVGEIADKVNRPINKLIENM